MKKYIFSIMSVLLISIFSFIQPVVSSSDINVSATVDKTTVSLGDSLYLRITFSGIKNTNPPDLPPIDHFDINYRSSSSNMSIINGQVSQSLTFMYTVIPLKEGDFTLGPFEFTYEKNTYRTEQIPVKVVPANSQVAGSSPTGQLSDYVFLVMELPKTTLYLNEEVSLTLKLYVNSVTISDIEYPKFSHEGLTLGEYDEVKQYEEVIGGKSYKIAEFNAILSPQKIGELTLGPATLKCNMLQNKRTRRRSSFDDMFDDDFFGSIFGGYQRHPITLRSPDLDLTVLQVPQEGKPKSYQGAIGEFSCIVDVQPKEVKAGDPITLRIVVKGEGNFNTVQMPIMNLNDSYKVYDPQITQNKDQKIFEQVIIPLTDSINEIPSVQFCYFDTKHKKYVTVEKGPFSINVMKQDSSNKLTIVDSSDRTDKSNVTMLVEDQVQKADISYIKEKIGTIRLRQNYLYKNGMFFLILLLFLVIFVAMNLFLLRKKKIEGDQHYSRRIKTPKIAKNGMRNAKELLINNNIEDFYNAVYAILKEYLGHRFSLPVGGITMNIVDEQLSNKGIDVEILDVLQKMFEECDKARFAPFSITTQTMQNTYENLVRILDYLERFKDV